MKKSSKNTSPQKQKAPEKRGQERLKFFAGLIRQALKNHSASDQIKAAILAYLGLGNRCEAMVASDVRLTHKAASCLAQWADAKRQEFPDRKWYFVTILDDSFNTFDRSPILRIKAIETKVNNAIRKWGVQALMRFEIQAEHQYRKGHRLLMVHLHGLLWTDGEFDHLEVMRTLNASPHWNCATGAKPIHIKPVRSGPNDLKRAAHYTIKLPHSVKNRIESQGECVRQLDTTEGYRPSFALRIFEGYSQLLFQDTIFGVGEGAKCWAQLRGHLRTWHKQRPQTLAIPADFDSWSLWRFFRLFDRKHRYASWRTDIQPLNTGGNPPKPPAVSLEDFERELSSLNFVIPAAEGTEEEQHRGQRSRKPHEVERGNPVPIGEPIRGGRTTANGRDGSHQRT
ncbi:hypothetical protein ACWGNZ_17570 [Sphingomonas zeae]|jgi:hypothetical protein